jgi:hypothetical protein
MKKEHQNKLKSVEGERDRLKEAQAYSENWKKAMAREQQQRLNQTWSQMLNAAKIEYGFEIVLKLEEGNLGFSRKRIARGGGMHRGHEC